MVLRHPITICNVGKTLILKFQELIAACFYYETIVIQMSDVSKY